MYWISDKQKAKSLIEKAKTTTHVYKSIIDEQIIHDDDERYMSTIYEHIPVQGLQFLQFLEGSIVIYNKTH